MSNTTKQKIIGATVGIISASQFEFLANLECNDLRIGEIVGMIYDENTYVLCQVHTISPYFYLENTRQYLVSKSVDNRVQDLDKEGSKPRYGLYVTVNVLGQFTKKNEGENFTELPWSIPLNTAQMFKPIYRFEDFKDISSVFGLLSPSGKKGFRLGNMYHPFSGDAFFSHDVFGKHTLITGVTGAGKSKLAALIVKQLVHAKVKVSVLDPHKEYDEQLRITEIKSDDLLQKKEQRVIVIDEAHMIDSTNCEKLIREGRKFGISFILISQSVSDFSELIVSQMQNHFQFRDIKSKDELRFFPDRICRISLYGGKVSFVMRTVDFK